MFIDREKYTEIENPENYRAANSSWLPNMQKFLKYIQH
jgi:hypothetical protein